MLEGSLVDNDLTHCLAQGLRLILFLGFWCGVNRDSLQEGVLVEVDRLDIMLVVMSMVECSMKLVIRMVNCFTISMTV